MEVPLFHTNTKSNLQVRVWLSQEDFLNILRSITSNIDSVQKNVSRIETLQKKILHAVSQKDVEKEKEELNDLNGKANSV